METKQIIGNMLALFKKSLLLQAVTVFILLCLSFLMGRVTTPAVVRYEPLQMNSPFILSQQSLNKSFQFPIEDTQGNEITKVTYTVKNADVQNDIILKGQRASAVQGKTFLVVSLKITNPSDKTIQMNTRDYIRLSANKINDFQAPDIHNDPVQIQPIATLVTRVGFSINQADKNLQLYVGEIDGSKTTIPLKLQPK